MLTNLYLKCPRCARPLKAKPAKDKIDRQRGDFVITSFTMWCRGCRKKVMHVWTGK